MQQHTRTHSFAEMTCNINRYKYLLLYCVWLCLLHNSVLHVVVISMLYISRMVVSILLSDKGISYS